jgi:molybdopterin converting factor small subunit
MKTFIPDALRSYTAGASCVNAEGGNLDELLDDLDRQFPGIRFRMIDEQDRMRPHVAFFVGGVKTRSLAERLDGADEVVIMQALSGG